MPEREVTPRLPTSGQIIGALVTRLGIEHPVLRKRTTRRYFSGDPERLVKDSSRDEIIGAIADVLTSAGFIASPQAEEAGYKLAPALADTLRWHAENWDMSRSFLRRRMARVLPGHLLMIWEAYIRLAIIDLAIRVAAHLRLAGSSPATLELLSWTSRTNRGNYLNQKRRQTSLSLEDFVEAVEVSNNTVDAWMYHGVRPSDDNIMKIAKTLADNIEGSNVAGIALELRALYWVSDVADLLAEHIGEESVAEAIERLRGYAETVYQIIDNQFPAEDREENLTVLADLGANARRAQPLLNALIDREPDDEWRADLRSATGIEWAHRVLSVNVNVNLAEADALIQKTEGRLLEDWDVSNPDAYAHYRRSLELSIAGKLWEALAEVETAARLDPLDPANHCTLGFVKTSIGIGSEDAEIVNEGLAALWLAVALDPKWILPWTEIGLTLHYTGKSAEAVEHLLAVKPECGPLDSRYHSALGTMYWKLSRLPKALAAFEAALELDPEETSHLVAASEIALLTGDDEKHRRYSRLARHFGADDGTFKFMELLREFGREKADDGGTVEYDRKIAVMNAVIRLSPDDDYAHLNRGLAHFAKGEDDLAIADLDAVLRVDPDHAGAYMLRGTLFGNRKQWERMISDMSELIRLRPDDAMAYYKRGQGYGEQDALDHALADLCEAIRLDPNHADAYRVRGDCLRYKGEYDKAITDFDTALRLDPDNAAACLGRGAAYRMNGDPDQAIANYDAIVRLKPEEPLAYRFRGDAYLAKGDYEQAIADCNRALKLAPGDPIAYFCRGNAHLSSGELELALTNFDAAVKLDPASGRSIYGRGLARELMGDVDGADEDYQLARELGYDDSDDSCE